MGGLNFFARAKVCKGKFGKGKLPIVAPHTRKGNWPGAGACPLCATRPPQVAGPPRTG